MITRRWAEVVDECFGPDKKSSLWILYTIIYFCKEITREDGVSYIQRKKDVKIFTGRTKKIVLKKLRDFINFEDVVVL